MTRKDYVAIASAVVAALRSVEYLADVDRNEYYGARVGIYRTALELAGVLAVDNPAFDRGRFHRYIVDRDRPCETEGIGS